MLITCLSPKVSVVFCPKYAPLRCGFARADMLVLCRTWLGSCVLLALLTVLVEWIFDYRLNYSSCIYDLWFFREHVARNARD